MRWLHDQFCRLRPYRPTVEAGDPVFDARQMRTVLRMETHRLGQQAEALRRPMNDTERVATMRWVGATDPISARFRGLRPEAE